MSSLGPPPPVLVPPLGFQVRPGEHIVAIAHCSPDSAFWGVCCGTFLGILLALPCFWWALPIICCVQCGEATTAKSRAANLILVLTNRALYLHNDTQNSALRRIPLEEIANVSLASIDSMRSGPEFKAFTVTTRENTIPVVHVIAVVDAPNFRDRIFAAKDALAAEVARSGGIIHIGPMSLPPQQPFYPPPPGTVVQQHVVTVQPMPGGPPQPSGPYGQPMYPPQQAMYPPPPGNDLPPAYTPGFPPSGPLAPGSPQQPHQGGEPSVRVFCILNSAPDRKVIVKVAGMNLYALLEDMKRKLGVPPEVPARLFLRQGVEVQNLGDLNNDDFVILCPAHEPLSPGALKAAAQQ